MSFMENKTYLYQSSLSEAGRYDEIDMWRQSHYANIACKEDIEKMIRRDFDGMNLKPECVTDIIQKYGFKRTGWVLANTIQQLQYDGRFHPENKAWAQGIFIPKSEANSRFIVTSHPAVLDGFVSRFLREMENLHLFGREHCETLQQELEGKVLVMSPNTLKESYWAPENQLWLATGGFGCNPNASGRAVYGICLSDGEQTRWNRHDFLGVIKDECLPDWAKQKLEEIRSPQPEPNKQDITMG